MVCHNQPGPRASQPTPGARRRSRDDTLPLRVPGPVAYGYAIRSLPHAVELADYELKRAAALSKLDAVDEAQVRR